MSRRAPVARQATSLAPASSAPVPATRSGRQPTLSKKQQENAVAQAEKEKAVQKKAYTEAVRSHQRQEEILGFQKIPVQSQEDRDEDDRDEEDHATPESEDDEASPTASSSVFSAISMPPVIKTTVRNGRTLVHRVEKENADVHRDVPTQSLDYTDIPTSSKPNKKLIRRVFGEAPKPPQMMEYHNRPSEGDIVMCSDNELESSLNQSKIRKTPPTLIYDDAPAVVVKKQKTTGQGHSKPRIRVGDFDQLTKSLTEDCIAIYRARIGAIQPFPVNTDNLQAVQLAWKEVCNIRDLQIDIEDSVFKAITDRASQIRGQVKTITKTHLFAAYGIDDVKDTQREVRNKIEQLLEDFRFVYKDPAAKTGMYMAPIIQTIINNSWFRDAKDDGVVHPEFSEGGKLSLVTLAFVLTVIENCLDEWATGSRKEVQLSQNVYKKKYDTHLTRLKDFKNQTAEHGIVPRLLKYLLKNARKHANVDDTSTSKATKVSEDDIEKAKMEWAGLQFSDDEGIDE